MIYWNRCGKVNLKLVVIVILVMGMLGVSLVVARHIHRGVFSERALAAGEAAFENQDWSGAGKSYREYLGRNPDDLEILRKYAQACLAIRPLDVKAFSGAIAAYRRIIELDPQDEVAYEKLALLYGAIGDYDELAAIARTRLEREPDDPQAPLWLANALIRLNRSQSAEEVLVQFVDRIEAVPGRHVEYVRACTRMSEITLAQASGDGKTKPGPKIVADAKTKALEWLQRAVAHAPESVEALLSRARFYRMTSEIPGIEEKDRLGLARQDLQEADRRGPENAQGCLFLAAEWLGAGRV